MTAEDASQRDHARLQQIREELIDLAWVAGSPDYGHIDRREALEKEAAEIKTRLGIDDDRPPLSTGSTRRGWLILIATALGVVGTLAILSLPR
ncbi:hypothetical protein AB0P19_15080 [Microbacterium oleivorans]|uniref:hypothetical protein n=1 Tax=Microbacterium TaxID=33882 RepID=UPI0034050FBF